MALVIRGATVVDPRDGSSQSPCDVLIDGDRIAAVGHVEAPAGATVVDGTGRYVVPGFCDMHAHPLVMKDPGASLGLMLAHGITGFRQMSGSVKLLEQRDRNELMPALAPRLLATSGPLLTPLNAGTAEDAVAAVRQQKQQGADFVKAGLVTADVFYAAQAEANRLDIPILGHLPEAIDVERVSGDGMRSIEHLGPGVGLLACCSSDHDAIHAQMAGSPMRKLPKTKLPFMELILEKVLMRIVVNPISYSKPAYAETLQLAVSTFDQDAAGALATRLAADGTWQVPTLIRSKTMYMCNEPSFASDPALGWVAPATIKTWEKATTRYAKLPGTAHATFRAVYATLLQLTKLLDDAGAPMLAGSDTCGAAWEVPGHSLHQEFDELGKAGLSPLRVLQMTTSEPATFLGTSDQMGSVTAGKRADLVLLDGDPLASVDNLHTVTAVVRDGKHLDRAALDRLRTPAGVR